MAAMRRPAGYLLLAALPLLAQDGGEDIYKRNCAPCHGPKGEGGKGPSLRTLSRGSDEASIAAVISNGIQGAAMPTYSFPPPQMAALVKWVQQLAAAQSSSAGGRAIRGAALVRGKGGCLRCHAIQGEGGFVGPDLSRIGAARGLDDLRTSLLDPEADIADRYGMFHWYIRIKDDFLWIRAVTADGRVIEGSRLNEDPFTIQIRGFDGALHSLDKAGTSIEKKTGKSPMPSYRDVFSPAELEDVVHYLSSLRAKW